MKKIVAAFSALTLALALLGAQAKTAPSVKNGHVQITFWHTFGDAKRQGWIQNVVKNFNAGQNTYVVVEENKGSYRDCIQAAILAARQGTAPSLVHIAEAGSQLAYDTGIFVPVGTIGKFDTSDYIQPVVNYYTIGGKVNSIPFNSSSPVLYVNTDMLKAAGYPADYVPETFSQVIKCALDARKAGVKDANISISLNGWFFEQWLSEQNACMFNNSNGRKGRATESLLDSDESVKIAEFYARMRDNNLYTYTGKFEDWDGSDAIFTGGKAMFHITSTADIVNITNAVGARFKLNVGMLPVPDGSARNGTIIGGGSLWVTKNKNSAVLEGARDFALYLTNTENMAAWHKLTGYYPVRSSSVDMLKKEGWFNTNAKQLVAFNQLLQTNVNDASAGGLAGSVYDNRTIIEQALQKILAGAKPEEAMKEAKKLADVKLAEYNKNVQ